MYNQAIYISNIYIHIHYKVEQDTLQDADVIDKILEQMGDSSLPCALSHSAVAATPAAGREEGGSKAPTEIVEETHGVGGGVSGAMVGGETKKKKY